MEQLHNDGSLDITKKTYPRPLSKIYFKANQGNKEKSHIPKSTLLPLKGDEAQIKHSHITHSTHSLSNCTAMANVVICKLNLTETLVSYADTTLSKREQLLGFTKVYSPSEAHSMKHKTNSR